MCRTIIAITALVLGSTLADAQPTADSLAKSLKPYLIEAMPAVLYEKNDNWGHQVMVPVGVKFRGGRTQIQKSLRNHAEWRKLIISAQELPRTLDLSISDIKTIDVDRQAFKVFFTFQMGVLYDQQNWESGVRLWSGSVRARTQFKVDLECENTLKIEFSKELLPDFVLRVRVTNAKVHYDKLVVEHIAGIGGTGAKLIGEAVHDSMTRWRPQIERDLLAKASAAIVQAADTREIRVGFSGLVKIK